LRRTIIEHKEADMDYEAQQRRDRFELVDPLEGIHMSARDREYARAAMQDADWIADLLVHTAAEIQALAAGIAHRLKQMFAKSGAHMLERTSS
jgi:hypothetical protein